VRLAILLLLILAMAACAAGPRIAEPPPTGTPWCFRAVAKFDGRDLAALGCFESAALCGNAQRRAASLGGMAGLRRVGTCREGR
jgi:hypothetical protein